MRARIVKVSSITPNQIVSCLTKEKLESIFYKYLSMITEHAPEFGYQEAENGGSSNLG